MLFVTWDDFLNKALCLLWTWKKRTHTPVSLNSLKCKSLYFSLSEKQWPGEHSWRARLGKCFRKNYLFFVEYKCDRLYTYSLSKTTQHKTLVLLHLKAKNKQELEYSPFHTSSVAHILLHQQLPTTSFLTSVSLSDTMSFNSAMICRSSGRLSLFLNFSSVPSSL